MARTAPPVDWEAVKRRLAERQAAMEDAFAGRGLFAEGLKQERARLLAAPPETAHADIVTVLVLRGRTRPYALPLEAVRRVLPLRAMTPAPSVPPPTVGLVTVFGQAYRVADIDLLCGSAMPGGTAEDEGTAEGGERHLVLLRHPDLRLALRVERAEDVRGLDRHGLSPPGEQAGFRFVAAIARDDTPLLDPGAIIDSLNQRSGRT